MATFSLYVFYRFYILQIIEIKFKFNIILTFKVALFLKFLIEFSLKSPGITYSSKPFLELFFTFEIALIHTGFYNNKNRNLAIFCTINLFLLIKNFFGETCFGSDNLSTDFCCLIIKLNHFSLFSGCKCENPSLLHFLTFF